LVLALGFNIGFCNELIVASYPIIDASLYIDGKLVGETPLNIKVKAGKYKLKAEKEGWIGEEREVIVEEKEEWVFVNIPMRKTEERTQRTEDRGQRTEKEEVIKPKEEPLRVELAPKPKEEPLRIVEPKIEPVKPKEELPKIVELPKLEPPKIEAEKIEPQKPKEDIEILILKTSSLIEEAEEQGAKRYARERLKNAKNLLKKAKKENSFELASASYKEALLALNETKERVSHYSSSYITGIFKNIGK